MGIEKLALDILSSPLGHSGNAKWLIFRAFYAGHVYNVTARILSLFVESCGGSR
jgi:hypothetical protein